MISDGVDSMRPVMIPFGPEPARELGELDELPSGLVAGPRRGWGDVLDA